MYFSGMFSDPHCRPTGGSGFNQVGGHEFQRDVFRSSLHVYRPTGGSSFNQVGGHEFQRDVFRSPLHVYRPTDGSGLFKLVDMSFKWMFSDPHCRPTAGSGFNQVGGHEFQGDVFRSSLHVYRPTGGSGFNQVGGHEYQGDVFRSSLHVYRQTYRWIWF